LNRPDLVAQIPSLRRYARALTGDVWAADDLVQDTLERACAKWRLWAVGTDLRAWLFAIMHNLHVSALRQSVRRGVSVDLDAVSGDLVAPAITLELGIDLQRCLLCLPDDQRAVLLLVSVEDLSYAQVARIVGVPVGTVMSRLSRARRHLQALMEQGPQQAAKVNGTLHPADPAVPGTPPHLRRLK
jgi:RNA polymerase sigma-70 factor (ECF subfamily)